MLGNSPYGGKDENDHNDYSDHLDTFLVTFIWLFVGIASNSKDAKNQAK